MVYLGYGHTDREAPHQCMAALHMARRGLAIEFIAWSRGRTQPADIVNITFRTIERKGIMSLLQAVVQIVRSLQNSERKILYVQGAPQAPLALLASLFVRGGTVIYHTQDLLPDSGHRLYAFCEGMLARRADVVIANEPNRAEHLAGRYHLPAVPNVIPTYLPAWWPRYGNSSERRVTLARNAGVKNIDSARIIAAGGAFDPGRMSPELLRAFQKLPENYVLVFTNMGETSLARGNLERMAKEEQWQTGRVVVLPPLPFDELMETFSACDIGLLLYPHGSTGHYYQAPGRLTEYLRQGLAVVASDFPGLTKIIRDNGLGDVADASNPEAVAAALLSVGEIDDQTLAMRKAELRGQALRKFVYETAADPLFERMPGLGKALQGNIVSAEQAGQ